ncbi:tetratricopeptide repeat protein [Polaromonas sp. YR568]|uniref:tetratricopeptide repeat protein n=1 Tax=Polaromonas sp. YR568 TaxID=1855301 RepID=UPI00398BF438
MNTGKFLSSNALAFQSAFTAHKQGRLDAAKAGYEQVLRRDAGDAEALHLLGVVHWQTGNLIEAEKLICKALAVSERADFLQNFGDVLKDGGRLAEAEAAYRRAVTIDSDLVEAHNKLSNLLHGSRRLAEAEVSYRRTLELKPDFAEGHNNLGLLLHDSRRLEEAELAFRRALELKPGFVEAHFNLGRLLYSSKRLVEAEAAYRRALALRPHYAKAQTNLGLVLKDSKRLVEAEAAYRCALELAPDLADAHNNLGVLLQDGMRLTEAEAAYRRAIDLRPDYAEARVNLSILLLLLQRYPEAWPLHESRFVPFGIDVPALSYPHWQGESLAGKSLMIWLEQGFGDYIQFVRYASLLKARGVARLTLVCHRVLQALLETVEGVDAVVTDPAKVPAHDYWSFSLSLPLHFATTADTIPVAPLPYVHALPDRIVQWRDRLPAASVRKVGLVWKGHPQHKNDANRSLPGLASLAPLWSVPGVVFISLQKGQGEDEAAQPPAGQALVALGAQLADFADSAAIVSQLDLVICVDTAIAHLAGAMNKPCWVLLPATGTDWRWQLDRLDSPWYPSIRLFRQSAIGDWSATVGELAAALHVWADAHA